MTRVPLPTYRGMRCDGGGWTEGSLIASGRFDSYNTSTIAGFWGMYIVHASTISAKSPFFDVGHKPIFEADVLVRAEGEAEGQEPAQFAAAYEDGEWVAAFKEGSVKLKNGAFKVIGDMYDGRKPPGWWKRRCR